MPRMGFEHTIPVLERPETVRAKDRSAIGTDIIIMIIIIIIIIIIININLIKCADILKTLLTLLTEETDWVTRSGILITKELAALHVPQPCAST
jgi:hypothetical protein